MDSFFVSCERIVKEELRNAPVAIAKDTKRSIASALSYEAKKLGAKVGMPVYQLKTLIPNIILVKPNLPFYNLISNRIFDYIYNNVTKDLEIYSIDECYIDMSLKVKNFEDAYNEAKKIQEQIKKVFKIPCSIGISYNKFLAKMSTNLAKPHGILITKKEDIKKHFYKLPINDFFGIGKHNTQKLISEGINTIEDFVNYDNFNILKKHLGNNFWSLKQQISGNDVVKKEKIMTTVKSIGNSLTFEMDNLFIAEDILRQLRYLSFKVAERLKSNNNFGSIVKLSLRQIDGTWISFQQNIHDNIFDFEDIYKQISSLFWEHWNENPLRGVGVTVAQLKSYGDMSLDLFQKRKEQTPKEIVNNINYMFNKKVLQIAKDLQNKDKSKISNTKFVNETYKNVAKNKIKI
ncbi:Y-family DNA polymerase [Mycoplasma zalophi]|uniref:DNA polymerase IV n=1 Tax=Mycoplasma zalophi TaxID=191287 RepID=A0ABS6DRT4_9MOLU|nr:DNA polymerase IV [Mycoplasma zalophi]MBU4691323.1 DNA polymerase IV [Mycoplasma zalophi]MBU4692471.1 DNA polymerase IV [Mycoplasma zalophi]